MDVKCNSRTVETVDKKDDEARTPGTNEKSVVESIVHTFHGAENRKSSLAKESGGLRGCDNCRLR